MVLETLTQIAEKSVNLRSCGEVNICGKSDKKGVIPRDNVSEYAFTRTLLTPEDIFINLPRCKCCYDILELNEEAKMNEIREDKYKGKWMISFYEYSGGLIFGSRMPVPDGMREMEIDYRDFKDHLSPVPIHFYDSFGRKRQRYDVRGNLLK
ncbi:hypothetical protein GOV14_02700 [Candidatus Pacearchaeota archaeon]|nr:hypothetical protein [Candidatus Pacearchaeota archaeon]